MSSEGARPTFHYDLGSPYAYLAAERVHRLFPEPPLWQPILLGALMKRFGTRSWALGPERAAGIAEVERRASAYGLPPDPWPDNYLFAMRVATYAREIGQAEAFALSAFRRAFVAGRDLSVADDVLGAAAACGLDPAEARAGAESAPIKEVLRAATERAAALGVHGVPTVVVGGTVFFGDDRLDEAAGRAGALGPSTGRP